MKKITVALVVVFVLGLILVLPAAAQTTVTYVVQPGDTLAGIARQHCASVHQVYHINQAVIGPNPNVLKAGAVLTVPNNCPGGVPPGGGSVPCDMGPSAHAKGPIHGNVYTVTFGDTMFSTARRFCTTVPALSAANGIANPWLIFAGQRLVIPGGGPPPTPSPTPTPPQSRYVTITNPVSGQVVPLTFNVSGTGAGLFEGNVVVTAYLNNGQQLVQQATTMQGADVGTGGPGNWQTTLTVNVASGTPGYIQATSPQSGVTPFTVSVVYGSVPQSSFIDIQNPAPGTTVGSTFTVSGVGGGLFENNVVVEAWTNGGQRLAQQFTTLQSSEPGGQGPWSVNLTVSATAGTQGFVRAYSPQSAASSQVSVTYGSGGGGSPVYKPFSPGQCTVFSLPNAPLYWYPGGAPSGSFGPAVTPFGAIAGAFQSNQFWYLIQLDPGSGNPGVWAPRSSLSSTSGVCTW